MLIKKCDRCGHTYENNKYKVKQGDRSFDFIEADILLDAGFTSGYKLSYDLCDNCVAELMKFLEGKEE